MSPIDVTNPADDALISGFPANERANRTTLKTIVTEDHDEATGDHLKVGLQPAAGDPALDGTNGFAYCKVVSGGTELFYEDDSGNVVQLTDAGSASPDKVAKAGDTMTGNLVMSAADVNLQGGDVNLENLDALRAENSGAVLRHLASVSATDQSLLGDLNQETVLQSSGIDGAKANYGVGDKKLWHEGNLTPQFTASVEQTGIAYADGVSGTKAHGFGAVPKLVRAVLVCTTIDHGWQVGDEAPDFINEQLGAGTGNAINSWGDGANIGWTINLDGAGVWLNDRSAAGLFQADTAKWSITVRAWY